MLFGTVFWCTLNLKIQMLYSNESLNMQCSLGSQKQMFEVCFSYNGSQKPEKEE